MRNHLTSILLFLLSVLFLTSCSSEKDFQNGYDSGYADGILDAHLEDEEYSKKIYREGHSDGYWEGYEDSKIEFAQRIIEEAEDYARERTGWSVYEAWNSISVYHDGFDSYGFDLPTDEEYRECVETLVLFCEYLDGVDFFN